MSSTTSQPFSRYQVSISRKQIETFRRSSDTDVATGRCPTFSPLLYRLMYTAPAPPPDREPLNYLTYRPNVISSTEVHHDPHHSSLRYCDRCSAVRCQISCQLGSCSPKTVHLSASPSILGLLLISTTHDRLRLSHLTSCARASLVQGAQR